MQVLTTVALLFFTSSLTLGLNGRLSTLEENSMILRALTNDEATRELIDALDLLGERIRIDMMHYLDLDHSQTGPAEVIVETTGVAKRARPFIAYFISFATLKRGRQFDNIARYLSDLMVELAQTHWPEAGWIQIMITIPAWAEDGSTRLIESKPFYFNTTTSERSEVRPY